MSDKPRVLIVEDEAQIRQFLRLALAAEGCTVLEASRLADGLTLAGDGGVDLVLLDLGLPDGDGIDFIRAYRGWSDGPVLILSARTEERHKIDALDAGADDYLTKPFALPELEVRLDAVLARTQGRNPRKLLEVHDLRLDLATLEAQRAGQPLHLYPACRKLLEVLMRASPAAVPRDQLEYALWGDEPPDGDMLRSHIYELRRSVDGPFAEKLLHTLPRVGYRLCAPAPAGGR